MEQTPSLDDLALFVTVAEAGGLAGAARTSGVSVPTLSRKMQALERQLGRALVAWGKAPGEIALPAGAVRPILGECLGLWAAPVQKSVPLGEFAL